MRGNYAEDVRDSGRLERVILRWVYFLPGCVSSDDIYIGGSLPLVSIILINARQARQKDVSRLQDEPAQKAQPLN